MTKDRLEQLAKLFNRSNNQLSFLLDLLDGDTNVLFKLENTIRNNFLSYCPGDKEEVDKVLEFPQFGKKGDGKDYKEVERNWLLEKVLGMSKEEAVKLCNETNYDVRVTREDLNNYVITMDLHFNRVNLELDNGLVTKSDIG